MSKTTISDDIVQSSVMQCKASDFLFDNLLIKEFERLKKQDSGIHWEAFDAFRQMQHVPNDKLDNDDDEESTKGMVQRRAPLNPLRSPLIGKFRQTKKGQGGSKVRDPALHSNPLRGRLTWAIMSSSSLFLVFLQALIVNKSLKGVFHSRGNEMMGPDSFILLDMGGLNANQIRKGELYRLFWSMWMHSGWLHITFNLICQLQYLWMLEPDWGFLRSSILYIVSGVTGNLFSVNLDPCVTTVGSSGALFGLMGGMIPYCIEYWNSIPRPGFIAIFSTVVLMVSILTGFTSTTDNWAHLGGVVGGLLFGLGTITSLAACERRRGGGATIEKVITSSSNSQKQLLSSSLEEQDRLELVAFAGKQRKKIVKRNPIARYFKQKIRRNCKCGIKEWSVRSIALLMLITVWIITFYFLLYPNGTQPLGHVTYNENRSCCCCDYSDKPLAPKFWTCNYCKAPIDHITWKEKCNAAMELEKTISNLHFLLDKIATSSNGHNTTSFIEDMNRKLQHHDAHLLASKKPKNRMKANWNRSNYDDPWKINTLKKSPLITKTTVTPDQSLRSVTSSESLSSTILLDDYYLDEAIKSKLKLLFFNTPGLLGSQDFNSIQKLLEEIYKLSDHYYTNKREADNLLLDNNDNSTKHVSEPFMVQQETEVFKNWETIWNTWKEQQQQQRRHHEKNEL